MPIGMPERDSLGSDSGHPVEQPMTLERALLVALANNPGIAASGQAVAAASAARDIAAADRLPRIGLSGGYMRHLEEQRLVPPSIPGEASVYAADILTADVVASMPLFTGGRLINRVKAAELMEESAAHRLERERDELVFKVTEAFFDILAQRRVVESLQFSREALVEHLRRVEQMISVQKAARVDLLRTEVRVADIEQKLAREQGLLAIREQILGSLLGLSDQEMRGLAVQGDLEIGVEEQVELGEASDVEVALERAYGHRRDYLAARANLEAEARRVDVARSEYMPTLVLQGSYGTRLAPYARDEPDGGAATADLGRIGVMLELPLFEGGRTRATVARERANLGAARERLRELELRIRLEVESAAVSIHSSSQRIRATAKASEQAEESLRIERQRYELGRGSITDVLDAQSALLEAQTSHYRSLADYRTALALLVLAVGEEI